MEVSDEIRTTASEKTRRRAELLFASVTVARSTSFIFAKIGLTAFGVFSLLGIRFLIAFLILAVIFHRRLFQIDKKTLLLGFLMGAALFAVMSTEFAALKTVSASETSLIENMAIVFVPLFEAFLLRRRPGALSMVCAAVAFAGVVLLTMKDGFGIALTPGEIFCFAAAVTFSVSLILNQRCAQKADPLNLGIIQVGTMGLLAQICAFLFESPSLPAGGMDWFIVLYLAVVCTCFGFTLQPVAQKHMSSERASLLSALNPLCAAVLSMIFLKENLGLLGFIGAALILIAIMIPTVLAAAKKQE
ncbi:MAG: DMT family transporter [Bacillota bacterium]|jgi:drug/metabolite transporter (DMT)-like permease